MQPAQQVSTSLTSEQLELASVKTVFATVKSELALLTTRFDLLADDMQRMANMTLVGYQRVEANAASRFVNSRAGHSMPLSWLINARGMLPRLPPATHRAVNEADTRTLTQLLRFYELSVPGDSSSKRVVLLKYLGVP